MEHPAGARKQRGYQLRSSAAAAQSDLVIPIRSPTAMSIWLRGSPCREPNFVGSGRDRPCAVNRRLRMPGRVCPVQSKAAVYRMTPRRCSMSSMPFQRLDRPNQYRSDRTGSVGDDIEHPMHPIRPIDIDRSWSALHHILTAFRPRSMRSAVGCIEIRLGFDNATRRNTIWSVRQSTHEIRPVATSAVGRSKNARPNRFPGSTTELDQPAFEERNAVERSGEAVALHLYDLFRCSRDKALISELRFGASPFGKCLVELLGNTLSFRIEIHQTGNGSTAINSPAATTTSPCSATASPLEMVSCSFPIRANVASSFLAASTDAVEPSGTKTPAVIQRPGSTFDSLRTFRMRVTNSIIRSQSRSASRSRSAGFRPPGDHQTLAGMRNGLPHRLGSERHHRMEKPQRPVEHPRSVCATSSRSPSVPFSRTLAASIYQSHNSDQMKSRSPRPASRKE